jgi:hypothetical protein
MAPEDTATTVEEILEPVRQSRSGTADSADLLRSSRLIVESNSRQLENPTAVLEYIDFFLDLFARTGADLDRLLAEVPERHDRSHIELLRQIANNAAAEQRRCLMFRDKWINKPLPYEQMRPVLNQISTDSRDQLTDYKALLAVADRLEALAGVPGKPAEEEGKLGRRELFTKWFGK